MPQLQYQTPHGITVTRSTSKLPYERGLHHILKQLDSKRGFYLSSGYEFPGRYSRWDVASAAPLIEIVAAGRTIQLKALNQRGEVLIRLLKPIIEPHPHWTLGEDSAALLELRLKPLGDRFAEEERSKQPSPFSLLRLFVDEFRNAEDSQAGASRCVWLRPAAAV